MVLGTHRLPICALTGVILCSGLSAADGPRSLTPESFDRLHKVIKPQPGEARFLEIPWHLSLWEAPARALSRWEWLSSLPTRSLLATMCNPPG
jgi:hypothetical protein